MIETDRQRQAVVSWIQYWKASIAAGEQSWFGQEQAQETVMALHAQVDAYGKRALRCNADSQFGDTQTSSPDAPMRQPAASVPAGSIPSEDDREWPGPRHPLRGRDPADH